MVRTNLGEISHNNRFSISPTDDSYRINKIHIRYQILNIIIYASATSFITDNIELKYNTIIV